MGAARPWQLVGNVFHCPRCGRAMQQASGAQLAAIVASLAFLIAIAGWLLEDRLVGSLLDEAMFQRVYDGARIVLFVALFVYAWRGATYVAAERTPGRRAR